MSHVDINEHPHMLSYLHHSEKDVDELLNTQTESKPAVWDRCSQSLPRIHLDEDDDRLPECKRQIKEIKAAIKAKLIEEYGEETWSARMPFDSPLIKENIPLPR